MFCVANQQGYFLEVNPAFSRVLGYSREELLSRPFMYFVHPDDLASTQREFGALMEGVVSVRFLNRYRGVDGAYRYFEWFTFSAMEAGQVYACCRDVTEREWALQRMSEQNQLLSEVHQQELAAEKYSKKTPNPRIEVQGKALRRAYRISIRDNSAGFDMRYANKLFAIFQRLHKSSDFPGTGIGLASVYRMMQRHGGKIIGQGVVGEGATFYLSFPKW